LFAELPEEVLEAGFTFFVTVGEEDLVVGDLLGELDEGRDLRISREVAGETDCVEVEFVEANDVAHALNDDEAILGFIAK
jgi:hypothetical protein